MSGDLLDKSRLVLILDTFKIIFGIYHKFTKYLKEVCVLVCDQHFSFKYILKILILREISPNWSGGFGHYRHERVNMC